MLHKNIIKLAALLWCVLTVASCTNEDFDKGNNGPGVPEGLPVTLKLNIGASDVTVVETKALENEDNTFGAINDLAVLVYDEKGDNPIVTFHEVEGDDQTSVSDVPFNAKTGKHKIYVLTNVGSEEAAKAYTTEQVLLSKQIESQKPEGTEMMLGFVAKDMETSIGLYEKGVNDVIEIAGDGESYAARVVPPYSKITFRITKNLPDMDKVYLNIHSVKVRKLPSVYTLMPFSGEGDSKLKPEQTAAAEIVFDTDEVQSNGGSFFYMYENKQGVYPNDRGPAYKSPGIEVPENADAVDYDTWFKQWDDLACTYIEVEGKYSIVKSQTSSSTTVDAGDIHYRFFLGEDITSNFNICRNKSYIVTLDFSQEAGYGELKHEWRVHAKLDEATFLPEGELVIDGYPQGFGYVPFYVANATGSGISMTTTNFTSSDMIIYYQKTDGNWESGSATSYNIGANKLSEYALAPTEGGIIGYRPYSSGDFTKDYDSAPNLSKRDDVRNGKVYNTRKFTITFTANGINETSELIVKEMPLLLLTDEPDPNKRGAVYARRLDGMYLELGTLDGDYAPQGRKQYINRTNTLKKADRLCAAHPDVPQSINIGGLCTCLPSSEDLKKIIELEAYNPLKNKKYWTTDGLFDVETNSLVGGEGEGYVRCVAKIPNW
ncbi:fimbrial protein [Parabacteroides johnsonii]|uniref:fimbrial protein n=1 Tax=Parabacteroides johnsonii TaxID=387661 RepID=UPI001F3DD003|nr:fimbrial protein [Parabacteroides johnsonii]